MFLNGEITVGAIGIMLTIVGMGTSGIVALITIYMRTRGDITRLQLGHADLKNDMTELKGDLKALTAQIQTNHGMLERVAARQEIMGAIGNLPNDLAAAIGKMYKKEKDAA